jgi:putative adhesin
MRRLLKPIALAACVLLSAAVQAAAQTDFEWTGQLAPGQRIEVIGLNGSIRASAATGGNIVVTAVKTAGRRGNPSEVRIETVAHAGGVTVCVVYPAQAGSPANECRQDGRGRNDVRDNDTRVDFTVQVPAGIGLAARTVNGSIDAQGLRGDTDATTVNGSVNLSTLGTARATTVNGSINASMGQAVWPSGAKFTTVNGEVTLRLPAATSAQVRVSTVSGGIHSDFPLQMSTEPGPKHAEGVIGGGGQRLDVTTVNGEVNLLRQ